MKLPELLEQIEKAAGEATQGEWTDEDGDCVITTLEQGNPNNPFPIVACTSHLCLGSAKNPHDNEWIALANPTNILKLIRALRLAMGALEYLRGNEILEQDEYRFWYQNEAHIALSEISAIMEGEKP